MMMILWMLWLLLMIVVVMMTKVKRMLRINMILCCCIDILLKIFRFWILALYPSRSTITTTITAITVTIVMVYVVDGGQTLNDVQKQRRTRISLEVFTAFATECRDASGGGKSG